MNILKTISTDQLIKYISRQIESIAPTLDGDFIIDHASINYSLERINYCISKIKSFDNQSFNYLNSGQYATFLYFLSKYIAQEKKDLDSAARLFILNKALNGIDLFYDIEMPDVFLIGHTVGMVFAKASYAPYCVFHQGCTVGRNLEKRPRLEPGVILYPNSSIIGDCYVRKNTILSPGVQLINSDTPGDCIVFQGENGGYIFKNVKELYYERYFK